MTRPPSRAAARLLALLEVPALAAVPLVLGVCAYFQVEQGALLTVVVAFAAVGVFFASFEASRPALRQIMPTVVLAASATSAANVRSCVARPTVAPACARSHRVRATSSFDGASSPFVGSSSSSRSGSVSSSFANASNCCWPPDRS